MLLSDIKPNCSIGYNFVPIDSCCLFTRATLYGLCGDSLVVSGGSEYVSSGMLTLCFSVSNYLLVVFRFFAWLRQLGVGCEK